LRIGLTFFSDSFFSEEDDEEDEEEDSEDEEDADEVVVENILSRSRREKKREREEKKGASGKIDLERPENTVQLSASVRVDQGANEERVSEKAREREKPRGTGTPKIPSFALPLIQALAHSFCTHRSCLAVSSFLVSSLVSG
jgi:hypothetical protein